MNMLYKRDNYLNKNIEYLFNTEIIEYDMKQAGYNLCKYYNLLPEDTIKTLDKVNKHHKRILLGLIQRKDKEFRKKLKDAFSDMRELFFKANNIEEDEVLSIKKDAIFVFKHCEITQFDNVLFVPKNIYTSYLYVDRKELYYNKNTLDVKGINDELLKYHKNGMLEFLNHVFLMMETYNNSKRINKFLKDFSYLYRTKDLPIEFYREFNTNSCFHLFDKELKKEIYFSDLGDEYVDKIDISYNYLNIIRPILNICI